MSLPDVEPATVAVPADAHGETLPDAVNPDAAKPDAAEPDAGAGSQHVARGTRAMAIAQLVAQIVRFASNIILARLLTPNDFGIVAIATVVVLVLNQFQDLGTGAALIQQRTISSQLTNAVFQVNLLLGVVLSMGILAAAEPLAHLLRNDDATNVLRALAIVVLLASLGQIHHALLRRDLRFKATAVVSSVNAIVTAVVSVVLALAGLGLWSIVVGSIAGSFVDTALVWYLDKWRPSLQVHWGPLASIWRFSLHLFLSNLATLLFQQTDKILIARWLGVGQLGLYGMAQRIVTYPTMSITAVLTEVAFPAFARRQDDDEALQSGFIRSSGLVVLVSFPLLLGAAAVAGPAVHVLFDPRWYGLIPLIWVLAPVGASVALGTCWPGLLLAKGHTDWMLRWNIGATSVLILSYIVGLHWGLIGLCAGYAIAGLLLLPVGVEIGCRSIGLSQLTYLRHLLPLFVANAAMVVVAILVQFAMREVTSEFLILICAVAGGGAAYLLSLWWIKPPAIRDVMLLVRGRGASAA